ncbi:CobW family GTP-binding protein [Anditalea andensis]|nr:GTP-binding protein [Anditalea andensis]
MDRDRIKIFLITGFLGSGKTTFLNVLLDHYKAEKNFVIENEYGKESIDAVLVKKNYNQLFEMNNGCLCCVLDDELLSVLEELISHPEAPDNLFIEASGVADTGILASVFKRDDIQKFFELKKIITIVDAENIEDRFNEVVEAERQVSAAELLIINKMDLINLRYADILTNRLKTINPFATIVTATQASIELGILNDPPSRNFTDHINSDLPHTSHLKSILMTFDYPFDMQKLYSILTVSLFLHYHQIYRIKGFVNLDKEDGKFLIQSTGKKLSITKEGEWPEDEPVQSKIVVIGKNIERISLERMFNKAYPNKSYSTY